MSKDRVVIVGAGVAGMSLAVMLAERGTEVQVLESRQRFDGPTSGVRISSEGVKVLEAMKLDAIGEPTERLEMRFGPLSASFAAPHARPPAIVATRLALHEQLMKRADALGIRVVTGFELVSASERASGIEAVSQSGETVTGTLLVGADGVGSRVRRILNPAPGSTKTYAGYVGTGFITRDETKTEMTLHSYPGHQVGVASCGKAKEAAAHDSVFVWTHLRMPEQEAKQATRAGVEAELTRRAERWRPELRSKWELYRADAEAMLVFGPVYNGTPPTRWYGERTFLIGDAAHPYGPGGQGISMALKDAAGLCDVIANGFGEDDKRALQRARAEESRALGEAAEKRNARDAPSSMWGVIAKGLGINAAQIFAPSMMKL